MNRKNKGKAKVSIHENKGFNNNDNLINQIVCVERIRKINIRDIDEIWLDEVCKSINKESLYSQIVPKNKKRINIKVKSKKEIQPLNNGIKIQASAEKINKEKLREILNTVVVKDNMPVRMSINKVRNEANGIIMTNSSASKNKMYLYKGVTKKRGVERSVDKQELDAIVEKIFAHAIKSAVDSVSRDSKQNIKKADPKIPVVEPVPGEGKQNGKID